MSHAEWEIFKAEIEKADESIKAAMYELQYRKRCRHSTISAYLDKYCPVKVGEVYNHPIPDSWRRMELGADSAPAKILGIDLHYLYPGDLELDITLRFISEDLQRLPVLHRYHLLTPAGNLLNFNWEKMEENE